MSAVGLVCSVSMETSSGMLRVLEFILRTNHRRSGLHLKLMFAVSNNFSLLFLSIRVIRARKLRNFSPSFLHTDSFFLIRSKIAPDSQRTGLRPSRHFEGILSFTATKKNVFPSYIYPASMYCDLIVIFIKKNFDKIKQYLARN